MHTPQEIPDPAELPPDLPVREPAPVEDPPRNPDPERRAPERAEIPIKLRSLNPPAQVRQVRQGSAKLACLNIIFQEKYHGHQHP